MSDQDMDILDNVCLDIDYQIYSVIFQSQDSPRLDRFTYNTRV